MFRHALGFLRVAPRCLARCHPHRTLFVCAGQEDYAHIRPLSYQDSHVFLVCFAVDNRDSFDNVQAKVRWDACTAARWGDGASCMYVWLGVCGSCMCILHKMFGQRCAIFFAAGNAHRCVYSGFQR